MMTSRDQHDARHGPRGELREKGAATALFALEEKTQRQLFPQMALDQLAEDKTQVRELITEAAAEFGIVLADSEVKELLSMFSEGGTVHDWTVWWKGRANREREINI